MSSKEPHIKIFEHELLTLSSSPYKLCPDQLKALQTFHGSKECPWFSLVNRGVKFNHHVGVIQVGSTLIEVLPKTDGVEGEEKWQKLLIDMLMAVGVFNIHAPSFSQLRLKHNSILELYFQLFLSEVQYLINKGLIRKYRLVCENQTALKGSLQFSKQIQKNLVHKERFFVKHSSYDRHHLIHEILYKTLMLLYRINTQPTLSSQIGSILLDFPEMDDVRVDDNLFDRIQFDRKTSVYKTALEIARLLLLNYHPDIQTGQNHVLALMFDMNLLWERFVFESARKHLGNCRVRDQQSKNFWKSEKGSIASIRPDILIEYANGKNIILDTKWKNLNGHSPSVNDLRQMFVYQQYFNAERITLVYPGKTSNSSGRYYEIEQDKVGNKQCGVIQIPANSDIRAWQKEIASIIIKTM